MTEVATLMATGADILLIEDDRSLAANLCDVLKEDGFKVTVCHRGDEGLRCACNDDCDVVLTDLRLPGLGGLELVRQLHEAQPLLPVVLMTAHGTIETAIEATKLGAYDYLQKPFEMQVLIGLLHRAVEAGRLMQERVTLPDAPVPGRKALVGTSQAMHELCKEIGRVATKPVTVLIRGETGTGKELIARAIYQHSLRAKAPFIAINCAAIPENLLESELFGHERGAFTGADQRRIGRFEQANGGTLFLDEIGDLPPNTQVKLLRVLQQQSFQRVGGSEVISVDVRVLAATHRSLEAMIREGKFREDLFHRLNVVSLQIPPLRERRDDIPVLVQHFLHKYAGDFGIESPTISADGLAALQADSWPGNVRELENVTRRLLLAARGLSVNADTVHQTLTVRNAETGPSGHSLSALAGALLMRAQRGELQDAHARMLAKAEREVLAQAITLAEGNQAKAARWLGLSRLTLREKLIALGLHPRPRSDNTTQSAKDAIEQ
jgi:nitrogen regulation protein NR(I)